MSKTGGLQLWSVPGQGTFKKMKLFFKSVNSSLWHCFLWISWRCLDVLKNREKERLLPRKHYVMIYRQTFIFKRTLNSFLKKQHYIHQASTQLPPIPRADLSSSAGGDSEAWKYILTTIEEERHPHHPQDPQHQHQPAPLRTSAARFLATPRPAMDNTGKEKEAMQLMAEADKKVKASGSFLGGMFGWAMRCRSVYRLGAGRDVCVPSINK